VVEQMRGRRCREKKGWPARVTLPARLRAKIAEAAYYRAQRRGLALGRELEDTPTMPDVHHRTLRPNPRKTSSSVSRPNRNTAGI
jgi:hypothetical protein